MRHPSDSAGGRLGSRSISISRPRRPPRLRNRRLASSTSQAPSDGLDLSSNHGAVKSVRQAARLGHFAEHGYTAEIATSFAQAAAKLAKRLGADTP